jgi:lysylphosphatidylglycerol synthetase-like protein (DUF2156 family)
LDPPQLFSVSGGRVDVSADAIRAAEDFVTVYASDADRPYLVEIRTTARVRLSQLLLVWWLLGLIAVAGGVALALPEDQNLIDALALLTFPLTLAGAVVLARETSGLAERLLWRWRVCLIVAIAVLWVITVGKVTLNANVPWAEDAWKHVRALADDGLTALGF